MSSVPYPTLYKERYGLRERASVCKSTYLIPTQFDLQSQPKYYILYQITFTNKIWSQKSSDYLVYRTLCRTIFYRSLQPILCRHIICNENFSIPFREHLRVWFLLCLWSLYSIGYDPDTTPFRTLPFPPSTPMKHTEKLIT